MFWASDTPAAGRPLFCNISATHSMVAQDSSPADSVANDSSLVSNLGAEARGSSALEPGSRAWLVSGILFLVLLLGMVGEIIL